MKCKVCGAESKHVFDGEILNKYQIKYYMCDRCEFLQTEEPYWIEEAYIESINISDTGYMYRNSYLANKVAILLGAFYDLNAQYLDFAGGYGVFVRMMRDKGFDFYWDDKYTSNLFVRGFEYEAIKDTKIEAITSFESFEHFVEPMKEIEKMLSISKNIIFSTELLPIPCPKEWWYYGSEHGQHISFYRKKTFQYIANKFNLNYANHGNLHVLTEKDLTDFKLKLLTFSRLGLHKVFELTMKSNIWDDFHKVSEKT